MTDENTTPASGFDPFDGADTQIPADAAPTRIPPVEAEPADEAAPETAGEHVPVQYGIGPFSLREVALGGVWLLAFIFSFFPLYVDRQVGAVLGAGANVWTSGIDWILSIGAPTAAVFLLVLRRFSPSGIRRVGSLGIDQFASVAFSVAALVWGSLLWTNIARAAATGLWLSSWVVWVEVVLMLGAVALTVFAPLIPPFHEDFLHRPEQPAHRLARAARPVTSRPLSEARYTLAAPSIDPEPHPFGEPDETIGTADDEWSETDADVVGAEAEPAPAATAPFWALAPEERPVVDDAGETLFTVGPTAWALVVEDRGDVFVIRAEDGRQGRLLDVSGVTRG